MATEEIRISWKQSIQFKIIAASIVTTTLVLGITGYFAYNYYETVKLRELARLGQVTADRISQHIELPMWNVDHELVNRQIEVEMKEVRIAGIRVRDEDQETLVAARQRGPDGGDTIIQSAGDVIGDYIIARRDIVYLPEVRVIGYTTVFVSPALLKRELAQFAWSVCIVIVVIDLLLLILVGVVLNRFVLAPLEGLAYHVERISRGKLTQDIEVRSEDEIGRLAAALNRMQHRLRAAILRLRKRTIVPTR